MDWRIEQGDSLALLQTLEPGSVDMILTDPPYSSGGQFRGDRSQGTGAKYSNRSQATALDNFAGDNRDQRGFAMWCALWLGECLRVSKPGALCALFTDWRQLPTVTDAIQAGGFVWRGISVWQKPNARPQLGRPRQDSEFLVWGTAGARPIEGEVGPSLQSLGPPGREARVHQTEKPVALLREWVKLAPPGGVVLDPFAGSGSTGAAALLEGRKFIGFELTEHYAAVARERLASIDPVGARSTATQPTLFG